MKLLFLVFVTLAGLTFAQVEGIWKNYTNMNDIVQMDIRDGVLWAGTTGGVFSYNISTGEYQVLTKSEGLSSQNVTAIKIHPDGNVWVGTLEGYIDVISPSTNSFEYITDIAKTSESSKQINDFLIKGDSIYVATDFGISLLNSSTRLFIETYTKLGNLTTSSKVFKIEFTDRIIALAEKGVAKLDPAAINPASPAAWNSTTIAGTASFFKYSDRVTFGTLDYYGTDDGVYQIIGGQLSPVLLRGKDIFDMTVIDQSLYILTADTIYTYSGSNTTIYSSADNYKMKGIFATEDTDYLITNAGITNFPVTSNPEYISPGGPALNSFSDMLVDNDGNLWAGSGRGSNIGGLYMYDNESWTNYNHVNTEAIIFDGFHRVYKGKDGVLYFSNWGKGFTTWDSEIFETFTPPDIPVVGIVKNPNFLVVWNVAEDSNNDLWLLNYEASDRNVLSVRTDTGAWKHFSMKSPLSSAVVNAEHFAIDQNDTKWWAVTSTSGNGPGLYYFNENGTLDDLEDDVWGVIKETDGLSNNFVTDIEIDNRGEIWVGTTEGVTVIVNPANPTSRMQKVFPLRTQSVTCIAIDPINRKWVGTNQGVFVVSSDGTELIANYTEENSPIPSNSIKSITFDENSGKAYIGSDFGLSTLTTLSVKPADSADELEIFPNPYIVGEHDNIYIDKLVKESSIKILSIDGRLIRELETPGGRLAKWDGKDNSGNYVSSGIYIVVAYDTEADNVQLGKIAVVRK